MFFLFRVSDIGFALLIVTGMKCGGSFTMKQKDGYCTSECWRYTAGNLGWHATPDCNNSHAKT
jgi:hypothetical protein